MIRELDLLLGDGTVAKFRQNWMEIVPLMVKAVRDQLHNSKQLKSLFDQRRFRDVEKDFGKVV